MENDFNDEELFDVEETGAVQAPLESDTIYRMLFKLLTSNRKTIEILYKKINITRHFSGGSVYYSIFKSYNKYVKTNRKYPHISNLIAFIENDRQIDDCESIIKELKLIKTIEIEDIDTSIQQICKHLERVSFTEIVLELMQYFENGSYDASLAGNKILRSRIPLQKVDDIKTNENSVKSYLKSLENHDEILPSGFDWLDKVLNGGWRKNMVSLIASEVNCGKTLALCNFAVELANQGKNGLFISYELEKNRILDRVVAINGDINIQDIAKHPTVVEKALNTKGKLAVHHLHDGSTTSLINDAIDEYSRNVTHNIDFVVLDYIGCMSPNTSNIRDGLYERYGSVIGELKEIASNYNVAIITAHQLNRGGYGKENVGMESLADSMKVAHKCDNVFFLQKIQDNPENGIRVASLKLDKTRVSSYNGAFTYFNFIKNKQKMVQCDAETMMRLMDEPKEADKTILPIETAVKMHCDLFAKSSENITPAYVRNNFKHNGVPFSKLDLDDKEIVTELINNYVRKLKEL